ncbi:MAG: SpoIID/LytB domain-containing protein [Lachnospiraceae bacterium]|nr:SpoIID/LytB domain-containing protein [Lachnospiraceae bacterium]
MGKSLMLSAIALFTPYMATLGWTGSLAGSRPLPEPVSAVPAPGLSSGKTIILDREKEVRMDAEQYLIGVIAHQIPADYQIEALKCQAVIARTYLYSLLDGKSEAYESELDVDYLEPARMEKLWGAEKFDEYYQKLERAVAETNGIVMMQEGRYIDGLFCRCSAGRTRPGGESRPYLASVDCLSDMEAEDYLQVKEWTPDEFSRRISSIPGERPVSADQVPGQIQIGERDEAGYVTLVQIGNYQFSGDEVRYALGLNSSFFRLENAEGNVRAVGKGIGHGYGLSQYDANRKAEDGWTFDEILNYFYQNIMLVFE